MRVDPRHVVMEEQTLELLEKYKQYFFDVAEQDLSKMPCHKKDNYWILDENNYPVQYTQCVKCLKTKPRTPMHFLPHHLDRYKNFTEWLNNRTKIGRENFSDTTSPCRQYRADAKRVVLRTNTREFWRMLGGKYGFKGQDLQEKFNLQNYGPISGVPLEYMIQNSGHNLSVSIHDIHLIHKKNNVKYTQKFHDFNSIVLDYVLINVRQGNKIDDLKECVINQVVNI